MVNKVIITGAGLIASAVAKQCVSSGSEVHVISRSRPTWQIPGVQHWTCDLTDLNNTKKTLRAIGSADEIRHTAALTAASPGDHGVNLQMTSNLLTLAKSHDIKKFTFFSGTSIYDFRGFQGEITEATPLSQDLPIYLATKVREENCVALKMPDALILRVSSPVGLGMPKHRLLSTLIQNASLGRLTILTRPRRIQDYIHVGDVAKAADSLSTGGNSGIFNVASGTSHSDLEVAKMVSSEVGFRTYAIARDAESSQRENWTISTSKLRSAVGDLQVRSLKVTVRELIDGGVDSA